MLRTVFLSLSALCISLLLTFSALNTPSKLSPQGCRMSYMSPSYSLQTDFNASWTSANLANRYRLMLYREVGWDSNTELQGVPVLFVPGNAGSAHQVRSIASSASRQYFASPSYPDAYFTSRGLKPLDVFAVDFNEDLSAFHGPTLESERQYTGDAVKYILSLYPSGTRIVLMGHSMGGIVATSLLPSTDISAIVTMSTPHGAPPARFDARMNEINAEVLFRTTDDPTPILSICGGITDTMIPSEFCALPPSENTSGYRRTVFTSSLEGCWTGVGHREMVWCHQVRWRVARVILELGGARTTADIGHAFDHWFRDGLELLPSIADERKAEVQAATMGEPIQAKNLLLPNPREPKTFRFDISDPTKQSFVLYLSRGSMLSVSPADPSTLKVTVDVCRRSSADEGSSSCKALLPSSLTLIPNPDRTKPFPVPSEGADESAGVVAFKAPIPVDSAGDWIGVAVNEGGDGWVAASQENDSENVAEDSASVPFYRGVSVKLDPQRMHTNIRFPEFLTNVLLVYRAVPKLAESCRQSLLPPLLLHKSGPSEGHYHRLRDGHPILLHGHSDGPFVPIPLHLASAYSRGLNLTIHSSGECGVKELSVTVDWWYSFSRWGPRYWNAILAWSAAVVGFMLCSAWTAYDSGGPAPTPFQTLRLVMRRLPLAMALTFLVSLLPLPRAYWLGNAGEPLFALLAPFIFFLSCGLVALSWVLLSLCMVSYGWLLSKFTRAEKDSRAPAAPPSESHRAGLLALAFISLLVLLFVPWQVAFLACFLLHMHTCTARLSSPSSPHASPASQASPSSSLQPQPQDTHGLAQHLLLAMTWCLPCAAPVLAVWARTLMTAGLTTPFNGDHNVLNVLPWMGLTYAMATASTTTTAGEGGHGVVRRRHRYERFLPLLLSVPMLYFFAALLALLTAPRATWRVYEALTVPTGAAVAVRVLPGYVARFRSRG